MSILIREVNFDSDCDCRQVKGLFKLMCREISPILEPDTNVYIDQMRKYHELMKDRYVMLVAEETGGQLVGFIDGFMHYDYITKKNVALANVYYVYKEYRNTSVPVKLYRDLFKIGKDHNMDEIKICTYKNIAQQWTKSGFEIDKIVLKKEVK